MANRTSFSRVPEKGAGPQDILSKFSIKYLARDSVPFDFPLGISGWIIASTRIPYRFSLFRTVG